LSWLFESRHGVPFGAVCVAHTVPAQTVLHFVSSPQMRPFMFGMPSDAIEKHAI